jgi:hypothetical protein
MDSTKRARDNRRQPWSGAPDCPVHQGTSSQTLNLRENPEPLHYNSPDSVRCSKEERLWNSPASGIRSAIIHRTVRWASGATTTSRQRSPAEALNARQSAQKSGTREVAHRTLYSACPVCHRTSRRAQQSELQRSEPNGLVTWLAHRTLSGVHRTVRCTMRQQPPPNG